MNASSLGLLGLASLALLSTPVLGQSAARYQVTFDATWSAATHPGAYPNNAHFSPLIGGTHNTNLDLWEVGALSSSAMESMSETGSTGQIANLVDAAIANGDAGVRIQGSTFNSPGLQARTFLITEDHPLVTLVTMIAPSPDWFLGTDSTNLFQNGEWVDVTVPLLAYDTGTDSGSNFTSSNQNTNPAEPISLITSGPFTGNDPLGTLTFTRIFEGTNFCGPAVPNSTGVSASLVATGSAQAGAPLTLTARDLPPSQFSYFLVSGTQGLSMPAGSSGNLCLTGNIGRFTAPGQIVNSSLQGRSTLTVDTSMLPLNPTMSAQSGETWNFQAWFRDNPGISNFTDGLAVTFQ